MYRVTRNYRHKNWCGWSTCTCGGSAYQQHVDVAGYRMFAAPINCIGHMQKDDLHKQAMILELTALAQLPKHSRSTPLWPRWKFQASCFYLKLLFRRWHTCYNHIMIADNVIEADGACCLAEALKINTTLKTLTLSGSFLNWPCLMLMHEYKFMLRMQTTT